ncbi:hypothetical protein M3J09_002828 [Ascochyta lentis]
MLKKFIVVVALAITSVAASSCTNVDYCECHYPIPHKPNEFYRCWSHVGDRAHTGLLRGFDCNPTGVSTDNPAGTNPISHGCPGLHLGQPYAYNHCITVGVRHQRDACGPSI